MLDLACEKPIDLRAVTQLFPGRGGRPLNFSTVWRWVLHGCRGPNGDRVRLEAVRVGGRWITSKEALTRFAEALTPNLEDQPRPTVRSAAEKKKANNRADRVLEAARI